MKFKCAIGFRLWDFEVNITIYRKPVTTRIKELENKGTMMIESGNL